MSPGTRRYTRALSWVATITSGIVLLVSGGAYGYVTYLDSKIVRLGDLCVRSCSTRPHESGSAENFLLVGVDSRDGANGTGVNAGLKDASTGGERSDTTLLVHISANRDQVSVVSFPRDLMVQPPTYTDGAGVTHHPAQQKFNAAFAFGAGVSNLYAAQLLTQQIEDDFNVPVDHYVQIDFAGFQKMVDALGGVQICLTKRADDFGDATTGGSGFHMSAGIHTIKGITALQFVRQRHGLSSDLDRINRQQRFLAAIFRKVKSAGTLTNPLRLNNFLSATVESVKLDKGTSRDDLQQLAEAMSGLGSDKIKFFTIPTAGNVTDPIGGGDLLINAPQTQALLTAIRDDQDPTKAETAAKASPAAKPTPVVPADPTTVTVTRIENASGIGGAAGKARTLLTTAGVTVTAIGDAAHTGGGTSVRYGTGAAAQAAAVANLLPSAHTTADSTLAAGAVVVTLGSTATAATSPAAASPTAAKPTTATNFQANGTLCGP